MCVVRDLKKFTSNVMSKIHAANRMTELNRIRTLSMGRKGYLRRLFEILPNLSEDQRKTVGSQIHGAQKQIRRLWTQKQRQLIRYDLRNRLQKNALDVSLPGRHPTVGTLHPISLVLNRAEQILRGLGFHTMHGKEVEDTHYNFDALNVPDTHPSRTLSDSFWFDSTRLLRTHTSSVQVRIMERNTPPIRTISFGRVYRRDYDRTHTPMFHQIEGLVVDRGVHFGHLRRILFDFLHAFFSERTKFRLRPSHFPFTKLSVEVDVMQKNGRWLEVLGGGMVHPKIILRYAKNSQSHSGLAFGIGVERLAMLHYQISDARNFFKNELSFLQQFRPF